MKKKGRDLIIEERIAESIFIIRDKKVMLDRDLAELYGVETKVLNQAVKRNMDRFPNDFMFQLSKSEYENLKSHFVTSSWGGVRKIPYASTEQGVAMLSSVLSSKRAIKVNISIMSVFVRLKGFLPNYYELISKIKSLEDKVGTHDKQITLIFETIKRMISEPVKQRPRIGFVKKVFSLSSDGYSLATGHKMIGVIKLPDFRICGFADEKFANS